VALSKDASSQEIFRNKSGQTQSHVSVKICKPQHLCLFVSSRSMEPEQKTRNPFEDNQSRILNQRVVQFAETLAMFRMALAELTEESEKAGFADMYVKSCLYPALEILLDQEFLAWEPPGRVDSHFHYFKDIFFTACALVIRCSPPPHPRPAICIYPPPPPPTTTSPLPLWLRQPPSPSQHKVHETRRPVPSLSHRATLCPR
jgi:hypothetical protein